MPNVDAPGSAVQRPLGVPLASAPSGLVVVGGLIAGLTAGLLVAALGPLMAMALLVGVLCVVTAATMPGVLLAAYLLIPFYKGAVQPYLPVDLTIILASANALQLIPVLMDHRSRGISRVGLVLWVSLAGLVLAGSLWATDQAGGFQAAAMFWLLVTVPLGAACLRVGADPRLVRQLIWSFFALGIVAVVLGMVNLSSVERLVVLGMNTIQVAIAAMLVPLVGVAFVWGTGRTWLQVLTIMMIPLAFVVALASGSRGPIVTLGILALVAGAIHLGRARVIRPRVVVAGLGGAALLVFVMVLASAVLPATALQRFSLFGSFLGNLLGGVSGPTGDTSSEARMQLIGVAARMFIDHPLLGAGTSGFATLSPQYMGQLMADRYPHNSVMQFAAEFGIVGAILFASIVGLALTRRVPRDATWTTVRALAFYFVLNSLLSNHILEDRMTWGLLLLLLLARVVPGEASTRPDAAVGASGHRERGNATPARVDAGGGRGPTRPGVAGPT
jgi:O-antigen ligase